MSLLLIRDLVLLFALAAAMVAAPVQFPSAGPVSVSAAGDVRRDVPYVPTRQEAVDEMLRMAKVSSDDVLYDLGSGDGRIVITGAKVHGARGVGIDIDPVRIREANANAESAGVTDRVTFIEGDLFEADLRDATAVTLYLLPEVNLRLRPKLLAELRPGTPVVSHDFSMGEWEPDEKKELGGDVLFLWIVPAQVDGAWRWTDSAGRSRTAQLTQSFQKFSGTASDGARALPLRNGRVNGEEISFELVGTNGLERYRGKVANGRITGTVQRADGSSAGWTARRD